MGRLPAQLADASRVPQQNACVCAQAYIRLLPEDYNSMLHFTGPELKLLQGTAALKLWSGTTKPRFEEFYTYVRSRLHLAVCGTVFLSVWQLPPSR